MNAKGDVRIEEPTRAERVSGRRAAESRATVPDLELTAIVEVSALVAEATPERRTAVIVRAAALALREHPRANAAYRDGRFELYSRVNVGVVMGAATPTIADADEKTVAEIEDELQVLRTAVATGTITSPELAGATFTVHDLGVAGIASVSPPVLPPQAGVLATGAPRAVPVVRGADIVPGHEMRVTLACDERILDGAHAAPFLVHVKDLLEEVLR